MKRLNKSLWLISFALLINSCASYRAYINPEADFGFYSRIGVLPFSNLSNDRTASEKVTSSFVAELLIGDAIEIATMGDVYMAMRSVVKDDRLNLPDQLTAEEAKAIGAAANLQGIFVGAVREYNMVRSGQEEFPLVSINLRFLDCQTGTVVWNFETTQKGGPKFPIFSFGETHTLGEMTSKVCRAAASSFLSKVK